MKFIFIVAILLLAFRSNSQDTINWTSSRKLVLNDFKGKPNLEKAIDKALTYPVISYSLKYNSTSFTPTVYCYFETKKSWIVEKSQIIDTVLLLKHEQLHFDIAQLYARKLKKAFQNYNFDYKNVREDLRLIYNKVISEWIGYDKIYDIETNHSINKEKQKIWDIQIDNELIKLDRYK